MQSGKRSARRLGCDTFTATDHSRAKADLIRSISLRHGSRHESVYCRLHSASIFWQKQSIQSLRRHPGAVASSSTASSLQSKHNIVLRNFGHSSVCRDASPKGTGTHGATLSRKLLTLLCFWEDLRATCFHRAHSSSSTFLSMGHDYNYRPLH